jgi:transposase
MVKKHIFGIDISKNHLDIFYQVDKKHIQISNDKIGFKQLCKTFKQLNQEPEDCWLVFEHTGLYASLLLEFCIKKQLAFTQVSGLALKRSLGLVRGKSDKIDAKSISQYAFEKKSVLKCTIASNQIIDRLKTLMNLRSRMVVQRAGYQIAVKEMKVFLMLKDSDIIIQSQLAIVKKLTQQIEKIELEVKELIDENEELRINFQLLTSITGVGFVLATYTLIHTGNFSKFTNARKFACYCGTAPFERTSGISIRGKTQVSNLANKKMKSLLDVAAKCCISFDKELKEYYSKRIAAGKSKMSSINVVRNKLIYRMFAVVKRGTPFEKEYAIAS